MHASVSARTNGRAQMRDSRRTHLGRDNRQVNVRAYTFECNPRIRLRTHRTTTDMRFRTEAALILRVNTILSLDFFFLLLRDLMPSIDVTGEDASH